MQNLIENSKYIVAVAGTTITWLFGAWDVALLVLVVFIVLDYITGVVRAYINKELSSALGAKGILKKAMIFIILICAVLLDRLINADNWIFRTIVCYFYIANEGISLLENCSSLGVPIPQKIQDALLQLKNKGDDE